VFILDGAHNPQGIEATADSMRRHFVGQKIVFVVGVMADKDVSSMMGYIAPLAEAFITIRPDNPRAMGSMELAEELSRYGVPVCACETVGEGVAKALERAGEKGIVCALGSLYFSGEARAAYSALQSLSTNRLT